MSATPLSDLITPCLHGNDPADWRRFHRAFLAADVGLWIPQMPEASSGSSVDVSGLHLPMFQASNGATVVRVTADPAEFQRRFDPRPFGLILGRDVLSMIMKMSDDSIFGVLVASAASEHSMLIPTSMMPTLLAGI